VTPEDRSRLHRALDATWAPAEMRRLGPWMLRRGEGGGKRVSAATLEAPFEPGDIDEAEAAMLDMGQDRLFMVRAGENDLNDMLDARGYRVVEPVVVQTASIATLDVAEPRPLDAIPCETPLTLMAELWSEGGISAPRLAVMDRTPGPKTYLLARVDDRPAGCAFVAIANDIAMMHALYVAPEFRRSGTARNMLGRAIHWSASHGATSFGAVTLGENLPARGLFAGIGMRVVDNYLYRTK
jgi:GNAT superfamily N-acetyltransferase